MARRVRHMRQSGGDKTLCNREITSRYWLTDYPDQITCVRCKNRAIRMGLLEGEITPQSSVVDDKTEEQHNDWLSRMGIL